jgi:hypothetical protein
MKKIALAIVVSAVASQANPWTECGIGGAIGSLIKNNNVASKVIASVTNVTWDLGTTATTSAVSTPDLCANKQVAAAKFINDTYASLEIETAKGEGQNLVALLDLAEVDAAHRDAVVAGLRSGMAQMVATSGFSGMSQVDKAQGYYAVFMKVVVEKA